MRPKRVLIVEDESIVQLHLQQIVTELGYVVSGTASTAEEACQLAAEDAPDLVLMDIHLAGDRDGIDAAVEIRDSCDPAIVFVSAYADEDTVQRAQQVDAVGYMVKPFDRARVFAVLTTALNEHQTRRRLREREQAFAATLARGGEAVIVTDVQGTIVLVSLHAAEILECEEASLVGQPVDAVLNWSPTAAAKAIDGLRMTRDSELSPKPVTLQGRLERGRIVETVVDIVRKDGAKNGGLIVYLRVTDRPTTRRRLSGSLKKGDRFFDLIGKTKSMQDVFEQIRKLAGVDWTVLIQGETGTGKELAARALHEAGSRKSKRFVPVNCAGLTESLLASQLFGHARGAFTGAVSEQKGLFELAEGGTLFLDEIGDISGNVQKALLRVLEDKEVTRLGDSRTRKIDVRLVAATQRDLKRATEENEFRSDLFFRLRVGRIDLPPLRERADDISLLIDWFVERSCEMTGKRITAVDRNAMSLLLSYRWPGNVRELKSAIETAVLSAEGNELRVTDLPRELHSAIHALDAVPATEKTQIQRALEQAHGNRTEAARLLGVSRATLYRRMSALGISK